MCEDWSFLWFKIWTVVDWLVVYWPRVYQKAPRHLTSKIKTLVDQHKEVLAVTITSWPGNTWVRTEEHSKYARILVSHSFSWLMLCTAQSFNSQAQSLGRRFNENNSPFFNPPSQVGPVNQVETRPRCLPESIVWDYISISNIIMNNNNNIKSISELFGT